MKSPGKKKNRKQSRPLPSFSARVFTPHKWTAIIQNPSRSSGRPTKAEKLPLKEGEEEEEEKKTSKEGEFSCVGVHGRTGPLSTGL